MNKIILFILLLFSIGLNAGSDSAFEKASDDMRFDNAYQFYRLEQYDKALVLLQEYLEVYEDGSHRETAFDYLAGIYFMRYDYRKALKIYLAHFEEFSDTEEGVRAYYNAGICYRKMGMKADAEKVFTTIISEYSAFQSASDARMQLDVQNIIK
ncbi:MAG TPA: tetratricopeptide repeat protein [Spirochaetota bacterium]|nr:tetratricopeptide repeat protein [Spirochaetota bacterium]